MGCGFINGSQVSVFDDNSHGTHVAGTIGAVKNGFGISGVNQRVAIMACKFLDADGVGCVAAQLLLWRPSQRQQCRLA